jgi:hypothetical protein
MLPQVYTCTDQADATARVSSKLPGSDLAAAAHWLADGAWGVPVRFGHLGTFLTITALRKVAQAAKQRAASS